MGCVEIIYEYRGYTYRGVGQWRKLSGRVFWSQDHWLKTPYFRIDWLRAPFALDLLKEDEFQLWIEMGSPEAHHMRVEVFTSNYLRRCRDVHTQLGVPLGEWEQLRLGVKLLSD